MTPLHLRVFIIFALVFLFYGQFFILKGAEFALPIVIKEGAWIGANSIILPGFTIGQRCVG
jgi:acetyltransferase-like isoleucine patch superfamily enzyme